MLRVILFSIFACAVVSVSAQVQTQVIGDSVFIHSNTGKGELILQNSTDTVNGFLFNKGEGRTEFRKVLVKIDDTTYVLGTDTLHIYNTGSANAWHLTGNAGTDSSNFIGTTDNQPLLFKVNNGVSGMIGTSSNYNTSFGALTLQASTGTKNTAMGAASLGLNTTGYNNTGYGYGTIYRNKMGHDNVAIGWSSQGWDTSGVGNTSVGSQSKNQAGSTQHAGGSYNTALGMGALGDNWNNNYNIGIGRNAGLASTRNNTFFVSDSTYHMYYKLDSVAGVAPSVIGKDADGFWHVYKTPSEETGFQLPPLTSGSVLFSNGSTIAQDNSNLFWDITNKRLGIGTKTPAAALQVGGNSNNVTISSNTGVVTLNGTSVLSVHLNKYAFNVVEYPAAGLFFRGGSDAGLEIRDVDSSIKAKFGTTTWPSYIMQHTGIGMNAPTAILHLAAGKSAANSAPLKFTAGTNLTTPENGAIEFNGTHFYATIGTTRYQLDQQQTALPLSLTTNGFSGAATLAGNVLNIPVYTPPLATTGTPGIVSVGSGLVIDSAGKLSTPTALFKQGSVPYAGPGGTLIQDTTGLVYDGNNLQVGHSGFYNTTGLSLNGGRGYLGASGFGLTIKTNGGTPMDASKSISFYNSDTRYGVMSMRSTTDSTLRFLTDMEIVPSANNTYNLGSSAKQWDTIFAKQIYIDGSPTGSGEQFVTVNGLRDFFINDTTANSPTELHIHFRIFDPSGINKWYKLQLSGSGDDNYDDIDNPEEGAFSNGYYDVDYNLGSAFKTMNGWRFRVIAGNDSLSVKNNLYNLFGIYVLQIRTSAPFEVTLSGGSVTLSGEASDIDANSTIILSRKTVSGTPGYLYYTISGSNLIINSTSSTDAGKVMVKILYE